MKGVRHSEVVTGLQTLDVFGGYKLDFYSMVCWELAPGSEFHHSLYSRRSFPSVSLLLSLRGDGSQPRLRPPARPGAFYELKTAVVGGCVEFQFESFLLAQGRTEGPLRLLSPRSILILPLSIPETTN